LSTLIDIQSQIQKLQKQAADIKTREFDKTVEEIRAKMDAFGITAKDLQTVKRGVRGGKGKKTLITRKSPGKGASKAAGSTVAAKYHGPNGETWTGRGLTPRWLKSLLEQGRTKEDFAIKA
jgi:DNA-binding protein H-NS